MSENKVELTVGTDNRTIEELEAATPPDANGETHVTNGKIL